MESLRSLLEEKIHDPSFVNWACERDGRFRIIVYKGMQALEKGIDELELSVRSYNCLRRAGYTTISSLIENVEQRDDINKIRNMGKRSTDEVIMRLLLFTYENLYPEKRKAYLEKIKEVNRREV